MHRDAEGHEQVSSVAGAIPGASQWAAGDELADKVCDAAADVADRVENAQLKRLSNNQKAFLFQYARIGTVTHAAEAAGVGRRQHYDWLKDADYAAAFEQANREACDVLEQEARRRATEGWDEPVFHEGGQCGVKRKFSDTLLIFLMKGAMPEKYRDNVSIEHTAGPPAIVEDENWYGNSAHRLAEAAAASTAGSPESGEV